MDYKTGAHKIDPVRLYYGIQLQTVVYLGAASELIADTDNNERLVIPAGVFYYNINDKFYSPEDVDNNDNRKLFMDQRPEGIYDSAEKSIKAFDKGMVVSSEKENGDVDDSLVPLSESAAIKLKTLKGGKIAANCKDYARSKEEIGDIIKYTSLRMGELAEERGKGIIKAYPYSEKSQSGVTGMDSCSFCSFHEICAYDPEKEEGNCVKKTNADEIYKLIHERLNED